MNLGIWTVTTQCTAAAGPSMENIEFSPCLYTLALCIREENLVNKLIGPLLVLWEAICEKGGLVALRFKVEQ